MISFIFEVNPKKINIKLENEELIENIIETHKISLDNLEEMNFYKKGIKYFKNFK